MRKIINKKKIDIINETTGKPVGPVAPKQKKLDLTDEIKYFLLEETNLDKIKRIILRLDGPLTNYEISKSEMTVHTISKRAFVILIKHKNYENYYFLDGVIFLKLGFWREKDMLTSKLKRDLGRKIYDWLKENTQNEI